MGYVCSKLTLKDVEKASKEYLKIIRCRKLNPQVKRQIIQRTVENIHNYFNKGYLEYRKSVTEAGDFAAIEWEGQGSVIKDVTGRKFIDFLGGYGIYNMGIRHPKIVESVQFQLNRMPLNSQELLEPLRGGLAQLLGELAPGDLQQCFFINNGTDAIEGAMKLARLATGRKGFISTLGGFHGKSMGALSLMGKAEYRTPFEPLLDNVHFVPFGDIQALEDELRKLKTVGASIAAFVAEPIQGEAGARVPPENYFPKVRQLCSEYGILFIADEVQTGMGRTGKIFAVEHWNVVPDILCLGKSLGGGVIPLSAFIASKKLWRKLEENPFVHSSTFGGNALACAAGIAAVNVMIEERLPDQAAVKGAYLIKKLRPLQDRYRKYWLSVHGKGLLMGMDFVDDATGYEIAAGLFKRGILVAGTMLSSKTIRIEPALNISYKYLDLFVEKLEETLKHIEKYGLHRNHKN
ncbi:aminotransferase class III-fold pyridoxal phosphate-dependent enzyme [Candidatus Micrarchaeota archaeon]|nr:aminotransferase class III-fold pyridoxal phosphate-dependent enzyme [Candidatus Micrarchaeota archaeon]